ncbi:MAG: LacI family DNA-binding transcriptional regulator [Candidatus Cryptobacteroides sp.]
MKATLDTIARNTGFSKSTISRVLNGKASLNRIPASTVKSILDAAEECGYKQNLLAKNLRSDKTNTLGLLIPSISNPYFADIASVVIAEAKRLGYTTIVTDTMEDSRIQDSSVTTLISRMVDGIIIVPCGDNPTFLEQTNEKCLPVMLIDRYYENSPLPYVVTNNYQGGYNATNFLIKNGHMNIACIQGTPSATPNKKRIEGYLCALRDAGIEDKAIIVGNDFSIQNGYLETKLLLNEREHPTAIFALSNTICLGAIKAIREAGIKIPDDISLISFDNNLYLDFLDPSVTRIGQMVDEMGKMAVKLIHDSISRHRIVTSQIELAPQMILRESVSPVFQ